MRFCEMAAVTPQTILWEFQRYYPAGSLVEAATSQSRWDVKCKRRERRQQRRATTNDTYDLKDIFIVDAITGQWITKLF